MELNKQGKIIFSIGAILILLFVVGLYFIVFNKNYHRAFDHLPLEQLSKISVELENSGVDFKYPEIGGGILIESSQIGKAKMLLAKNNLFKSESVGLEIFDKQQNTMSDFYQKINYQRAIQGELEKTLVSIQGIEAARVHVAFPKERAFYKNKQPVTAAVTLTFDHVEMHNRNAIVITAKRLLSNSITGLNEDHVDVLDNSGQLLSLLDSGSSMAFFSMKQDVELSIEGKVKQLLAPYYDISLIGVSSWATVNNDKVTEVLEGLDSDQKPIVIKRETETTERTRKKPKLEVMSEEYSYKNLKREIDYQQGRLERISVSVIVPDNKTLSFESLTSLLSSGLGIDLGRGDSLSVVLAPMNGFSNLKQSEPEPEQKLLPIQKKVESFEYTERSMQLIIVFFLFTTVLLLCKAYKEKKMKLLSKHEKTMIINELQAWVNEK